MCVVEGGEARPYIPRDVTKLADLVMPLTSAREVGRGSALLLPSVVVFVSGVLFVTLLLYDTVEDFILREAERVSRGILEEREAVLREEPGRSSSTGVQGNEHIPDEDEAPDDVSIPRPINDSSMACIFCNFIRYLVSIITHYRFPKNIFLQCALFRIYIHKFVLNTNPYVIVYIEEYTIFHN